MEGLQRDGLPCPKFEKLNMVASDNLRKVFTPQNSMPEVAGGFLGLEVDLRFVVLTRTVRIQLLLNICIP